MSGRLHFSDVVRVGIFSEDFSYLTAGVYLVEIEALVGNEVQSHILKWVKN
jgi:hypothetical protein